MPYMPDISFCPPTFVDSFVPGNFRGAMHCASKLDTNACDACMVLNDSKYILHYDDVNVLNAAEYILQYANVNVNACDSELKDKKHLNISAIVVPFLNVAVDALNACMVLNAAEYIL